MIFLTNCKKEVDTCTYQNEFNALIQSADYDQTIPLINLFLSGQDKNISNAEKLQNLADWLKCKSSVSTAEVLCNSCIKTNPAQSEFYISYIVNGQNVDKTLDILMSQPLRALDYHK